VQSLASTAIVLLDEVQRRTASRRGFSTLRFCFVSASRSEFTSPFGDLLRHRWTGSFGFGVLISWTDSLSRRLSLRRDGDAWETKEIGSRYSVRAKPEHCCRRRKRDSCKLVPDAGEQKQPSLSISLKFVGRERGRTRARRRLFPHLLGFSREYCASTEAIELTLENRIRVGWRGSGDSGRGMLLSRLHSIT